LEAAQPGFEDAPLRGVEHDGHAANVGLGGDEVEERDDGGLAVDEGFVDVDVDEVGPVFDLLLGD